MTHTTQVLSERQIKDFIDDGLFLDTPNAIARAIESATLKAVRGQEPVAWRWFNELGEVVTLWNTYQPSLRDVIEQEVKEARGTIQYAYTTPPAQPAPTDPDQCSVCGAQPKTAPVDEREAFERYMTDNGKWPQAVQRYDNEPKGYVLLQTASAWEVWQARAALQCAQAPQPTKGQP